MRSVDEARMKRFTVVLFGAGGVGKSALLQSFLSGAFTHEYIPTIEDTATKFIKVDGHDVFLTLIDTAGTEQFTAMRDLYIKNANGFILVYSITDESSYEYIIQLIEVIYRVKNCESVPIVIVGNKCDLKQDRMIYPREVSSFINSKFQSDDRDRLTAPRFLESSVREKINIMTTFNTLVGEIMKLESIKAEKSRKEFLKQCNVQ